HDLGAGYLACGAFCLALPVDIEPTRFDCATLAARHGLSRLTPAKPGACRWSGAGTTSRGSLASRRVHGDKFRELLRRFRLALLRFLVGIEFLILASSAYSLAAHFLDEVSDYKCNMLIYTR